MKSSPIYLAMLIACAGCVKKTDDLFDKPADARIQESLTAYRTRLVQAPGWKLFVYPTGLRNQGLEVGGLTYYLDFPDSSRVSMVSDFTEAMASVPKESGFRVRAVQRPSLVFDTYSYIHVAADPDENVSATPAQAGGYGWGTDFEFSFLKPMPEGDSMALQGNFNETEAILLPATEEEMTAAFRGDMADIMAFARQYAFDKDFLYFNGSDGSRVAVSLGLYLYQANFTIGNGTQLSTITVPFSHTINGLHFKSPVTAGGYTFQDLFVDRIANQYYIDAGGTRVNLLSSASPVYNSGMVLGQSVTSINVPFPADSVPGQSAVSDTVFLQVANNLRNRFSADLLLTSVGFDANSRTMALFLYIRFQGFIFPLQYFYSYSVGANESINFARTGQSADGSTVESEVRPLLDYIEGDTFRIDYSPEDSEKVLGLVQSLDHANFFFTGNIR